MATKFRLRRSATADKRPVESDLLLGELALNTYDGRLYTKRDTNNVGIADTAALLTPWTENFGGGSIYYDNNVGIGTTNPDEILHLGQLGTAGNNYNEGRLKIGGLPGTDKGLLIGYDNRGSGRGNIVNANNSGGAANRINIGFGAITASGAPTTEVVTINQSGKVGIGTNDPDKLFDVRSNSTDTKIHIGSLDSSLASMPNSSEYGLSLTGGNAELGLYKDGSGNYSYVMGTYQGTTDIPIVFRSGNREERLRITKDGNVTTTGSSTFSRGDAGFTARKGDCVSITRDNGTPLEITRTSAQGNMINFFDTDATTQRANIQLNSNDLVFGLTGEKLRITSGGDVGIGNDSPSCKLAIKDTASHTDYANATPSVGACMLQLYNNPSSEAANDHSTIQFGVNGGSHNRVNTISAVSESGGNRKMAFTFCTDEAGSRTEKMRITGDGNVGIGSLVPDYMLDVSGAINSETDVKVGGVSVSETALNDAVAMAIALG